MDQNNPYEFITNPQAPKKTKFAFSGKQKPFVLVGFAIFVLTIVIVALMIFNSLTAENNQDLLTVGGTQTELMELASLGAEKGRSSSTKNMANTLSFAVTTDNKELRTYLASKKVKVPKNGFPASTKTIKDKLVAAEQNNTFDDTFNKLYTELSTEYLNQLKTAYGDTQSNKEKTLLQNFNQAIVVINGPTKENT